MEGRQTPPLAPLPKGHAAQNDEEQVRHLERGRMVVKSLLDVFTMEQLEQLVELAVQTHDLAVLRGCRQTLTVVFNEKGYPRELSGSNAVNVVKPRMYNSE